MTKTTPEICEECGLPIEWCNANAMVRIEQRENARLEAKLAAKDAQIARLTAERDAALAQVAGAFEAASHVIGKKATEYLRQENDVGSRSRALCDAALSVEELTPADATAALDRIKRQARAEGMRKAAGVKIACAFDGSPLGIPHSWRAAILAAAKQEEQWSKE